MLVRLEISRRWIEKTQAVKRAAIGPTGLGLEFLKGELYLDLGRRDLG